MKIDSKIAIVCVVFVALTALVFQLFSLYVEEKPENTVKNIYDDIYNKDSVSSSLDTPEIIYASSLLILIQTEQERQAASGELGELSADPLCNCQDPSAVEVINITPKHTGSEHATVAVDLAHAATRETITLHLTKENGRWMVSDVLTQDVPSLKKSLTAD